MGLVVKFGGRVLRDNYDVIKAAQFIKKNLNYKEGLIVVVGAMGNSTYEIMDEAFSLCDEPQEQALDFFLSTAEQAAAARMTMALHSEGLAAIPLNGFQLGIRTSGEHRNAHVESIDVTRIKREL